MKTILLTMLIWIGIHSSLFAKVWINEFMQSNIDLIFDEDDQHEFPDSWIELYNDADEEINIANWRISDNSSFQSAWVIRGSNATIPAKGYLIIYADKVNKTAEKFHTNFRLDSESGGSIYLFDANGVQIDAVLNIPKQPAPNIARGRTDYDSPSWAYFVAATPGAANEGKTSNTLLPPPIFSQKGGIYKSTTKLQLSCPPNAPAGVVLSDIHYTLDNTEPTSNSPSYTGELTIISPTVVRAKLIHPDYLTDRATVHTYIISAKTLSLPVVSISTAPEYLWNEDFGIYCKGNGKYGQDGRCLNYKVNWNNDWRRPCHFEYFTEESSSAILNQLCELRIAGGCTRAEPQKSFILYANKRFGTKRFDYDFFTEKPNQKIKSFMIRNSGNDFWWTHFRDAAIQLFMGGKVDVDYQAYQPAIFYLNGNYWGIQNLRERSEEDFVFANYDTEDVDVLENWSWGGISSGDRVAFDRLMTELRKSSSQRNYQWIMSQVDIDEYINYMILQVYILNTDFPHNNVSMWRRRTTDGKWRFILKDTDFGLGIWDDNSYTHNAMRYNTENNNDERKLFNALLTQDSFKQKFYGRFAVYMGDLLHYRSTSNVIDSIQRILEPAMQDHLTRWLPEKWWRDMASWRNEVTRMKNWCNRRNVEVYKHLQDYFKLGTIMKLTFEKSNAMTATPDVFINDVRIRNYWLDASYFQKEKIDLHYEAKELLYAWEITQTVNGKTTVETFVQQKLSYQIVSGCTSVKIKLVDKSDITFAGNELTEPLENKVYAANGQMHFVALQPLSIISIYDTSGKLLMQTSTNNNTLVIPFNRQGVFIVQVRNQKQTFTQKVISL